MTQKIEFAKGLMTDSVDEYSEIINGVEYHKEELDEKAKSAVRFLYGKAEKYKLTHRPLDQVCKPYEPLKIKTMENTILRPELAMIKNGETTPCWIAEVSATQDDPLPFLIKTHLYQSIGIEEYWVIVPELEVILVYTYEKSGLVPAIYNLPRRLKVSPYKEFFMSFTDIFKFEGPQEH